MTGTSNDEAEVEDNRKRAARPESPETLQPRLDEASGNSEESEEEDDPLLSFRHTAASKKPQAKEQPPSTLLTAAQQMATRSPEQITQILKNFYDLADHSPMEFAQWTDAVHCKMARRKKASKLQSAACSPVWFLFKSGTTAKYCVDIGHSAFLLTELDIANDEYHDHMLVFCGDRDENGVHKFLIHPDNIFTKHTKIKVGKLENIKENARQKSLLATTKTTPAEDTFFILPLVGKEICAKLAAGLYPTTDEPGWTVQKTVHELMPYQPIPGQRSLHQGRAHCSLLGHKGWGYSGQGNPHSGVHPTQG